jgi:hypothetical protein
MSFRSIGTYEPADHLLGDVWRFIGSFDAIPKDCDLMVAVIDHDGRGERWRPDGRQRQHCRAP